MSDRERAHQQDLNAVPSGSKGSMKVDQVPNLLILTLLSP